MKGGKNLLIYMYVYCSCDICTEALMLLSTGCGEGWWQCRQCNSPPAQADCALPLNLLSLPRAWCHYRKAQQAADARYRRRGGSVNFYILYSELLHT
jgi:hypothetical protein